MPRPDLSRRQFLARSATIAGASLGLAATRPSRAQGDSEVRLGFLGVGDRGRHLLGAALSDPRARVVSIADVHPEHLARAVDIVREKRPDERRPRALGEGRALLEDETIDAVVIATPVWLHAEETLAALAAGKHVYCEKPLALDLRSSAEVLRSAVEAEARGQIYQAGLQRRYNPRYQASVRHVHAGEAGELRYVRAQWHAVAPAKASKPWLHRRDRSGDIVVEQATHQFDVFNWLLRAVPTYAMGLGGRFESPSTPVGADTLDHYAALLEYPGGVKVQLSHLTFAVPDRRFSGVYELAFCEETGVDLANALTWRPDGTKKELCRERGNDTALAMESFVTALLEGRRPLAGAVEAYAATRTALLVREAVERQARVGWDEIA